MAASRVYRATRSSITPYVKQSAAVALATVPLYLIYHSSRHPIALVAVILAVIFQVLVIHWPLVGVAFQRTNVSDLAIEVGPSARCRIAWCDVSHVQVFEKYDTSIGPARTDRFVVIRGEPFAQISCNTNAWPRPAEDEFLELLACQAAKYEFPIDRVTT